ncbi:LuxR C-terminal-related transcriptional regulator [Streptomyces sp. NPDC050560]|uniref:LuxR C-terminal-related transcriptional regulator n=1 Tax=Streptomyces sp. NPDC050560 TaxID=3365630 RepID=UPI0037A17D26
MDITELLSTAPLGELERSVYQFAVHRVSLAESDVHERCDAGPEAVARAFRTLLALGLLRERDSAPGVYTAVSPDSAELQLVGPVMRRVADLQGAMGRLRDEFSGLAEVYREGMVHRMRSEGVEIIPNLADVRARLDEHAVTVKHEIRTSQPGGARPEEVLAEAMGRTEGALARGVLMRTLYQHTAQFSQATLAFVERVTAQGAEIRTLGDAFSRLIVFDRDTAFIGLRDDPRGAALVRDPSVVAFMVEAFDRAWVQARPFPSAVGRKEAVAASDAVKADIVRILLAGEDDKAIARRMGMSVRTCQRHINEVMARAGARNRVQAGYLLGAPQLPGGPPPYGGSPPAAPPRAPLPYQEPPGEAAREHARHGRGGQWGRDPAAAGEGGPVPPQGGPPAAAGASAPPRPPER